MSRDLHDFITGPVELLALGEPTHPTREPVFGHLRNEVFATLVDHGFRSIAVETDRIAALIVDDFIQGGPGNLDTVMSRGFSHGFGGLTANRHLVDWMREYNRGRVVDERLTFHGFDIQAENTSAHSPRGYLEHAGDYLGVDVGLASLFGTDDRWSREEAILDPARSVGAGPEAVQLCAVADDLLTDLHARAPELIAATSRADWFRARTHLTGGIGLLRYHRAAARRIDEGARISGLLATRDALMAQNLLDIRTLEQGRGATLVAAHNSHLQRHRSTMNVAGMKLDFHSAGAIVDVLMAERYRVVIGSLGGSDALGLGRPVPDTYEGFLQAHTTGWGVTPAAAIPTARRRTDTRPEQVYSPLDQSTIDSADAILHLADPTAVSGQGPMS